MFVRMADKLTGYMLQQDMISDDKKEFYRFGIQQGMVLAINLITFFVIGICFGMVWQTLAYLMAYIPVRVFAGGYHARTQERCYILSCALVSAVLGMIQISTGLILVYLIASATSCIIILILAPVGDRNKPLDPKERTVYGHRARIMVLTEFIICVISSFFWEKLFLCIVLALITNGLMVLTGYMINTALIRKRNTAKSML